jgi:hypothetical protein
VVRDVVDERGVVERRSGPSQGDDQVRVSLLRLVGRDVVDQHDAAEQRPRHDQRIPFHNSTK